MNRCFTLCLAVLCLAGCNYDYEKKAMELAPFEQKITSPEQITYKLVNQSILKTSCLNCHSAAAGDKGGINLESFETVSKNASQIRKEVAGKTMPPGGQLTETQIKLLTDWIDAGAHENGTLAGELPTPTPAPTTTPTPTPEPEPIAVTFAKVQELVIKTNCLKCHSAAGGNSGDVNLETYKNVFDNRFEIKMAVETGQMPTKRGTPLTKEQKELILTWIANGSPEN